MFVDIFKSSVSIIKATINRMFTNKHAFQCGHLWDCYPTNSLIIYFLGLALPVANSSLPKVFEAIFPSNAVGLSCF